jgi:hypothetical protein
MNCIVNVKSSLGSSATFNLRACSSELVRICQANQPRPFLRRTVLTDSRSSSPATFGDSNQSRGPVIRLCSHWYTLTASSLITTQKLTLRIIHSKARTISILTLISFVDSGYAEPHGSTWHRYSGRYRGSQVRLGELVRYSNIADSWRNGTGRGLMSTTCKRRGDVYLRWQDERPLKESDVSRGAI